MKRTLTIRVDDETLTMARALAARRTTSVTRLVADVIRGLVAEDDAYERVRAEAVADLASCHDLGSGGRPPPRDSVHVR